MTDLSRQTEHTDAHTRADADWNREARKETRRGIAAVLEAHPLPSLDGITVKVEYDRDSGTYVTWIPELNGISTFGRTIEEALQETRDLVVGWLATMEENGLSVPLSKRQISEIRAVLGA